LFDRRHGFPAEVAVGAKARQLVAGLQQLLLGSLDLGTPGPRLEGAGVGAVEVGASASAGGGGRCGRRLQGVDDGEGLVARDRRPAAVLVEGVDALEQRAELLGPRNGAVAVGVGGVEQLLAVYTGGADASLGRRVVLDARAEILLELGAGDLAHENLDGGTSAQGKSVYRATSRCGARRGAMIQ
jgi:hypothetical protein